MEATRASLLARIRNVHDTQAWREFDSIYRPMLYRFARSRGLDRASAEDVVQRCMAAVVRQAPTFQYQASKGKFRNWLRKVAENKVRDLLRAQRVGGDSVGRSATRRSCTRGAMSSQPGAVVGRANPPGTGGPGIDSVVCS